MLEVRLFGQFDLRVGGQAVVLASRPGQALLAYLLMQEGVAQRREKLAALLWPDSDDANARKNLRQALWQIRKALGSTDADEGDYLLADELTIAFNRRADFWLDTAVLEDAAHGACTTDELVAAVTAYRGELLPGFYDEWAVLERERLEALFDRVVQALLNHLLAEQRWAEAIDWAERWISLGHVPEPAYRALMQAHQATGDAAAAAAAYQRCRTALREQLGVEPSPLTQRLFANLRRHQSISPAPEVEAAAPAIDAGAELAFAGPPPFQGLRCFEAGDAARFFGRERLTEALAARLNEGTPLLFVVGASGSGKSSLVRAGLIPALRAQPAGGPDAGRPGECFAWRTELITPTAHPLQALAAGLTRDALSLTATTALTDGLARDPRSLRLAAARLAGDAPAAGSPAPRLALIVDQFEEIFTLCRAEDERRTFVANLLAAGDGTAPIAVVIALRADFYTHCAAYPELRAALAGSQEYIGPMSTDELRRSIEEPARAGGWAFDAGVVDLILRDVGDEPGGLPLLSHALLETWRHRSGRTLTLASYAASGGVHAALARSAERFYESLPAEEQALARGIFLRLTELGEGTQDTRRRAALAELVPRLEAAPAVQAILDELARARLVTVSEGTAEVAHEALIREWPMLRGWLAADREGLRLHRRLTEAAAAWTGLERDPGELYRGARLAQVAEWVDHHPGELNPLEEEFLAASRDQVERDAADEEARRRRELAAARRLAETERRAAGQLRRRALWLSGTLLVAAGLAVVALLLASRATTQARLATGREWAAAAIANLPVDPERSLLLALQAVRESDVPEARDALHRAIAETRVRLTLTGHRGPVVGLAASPDGSRLATLGQDGYLKIWDTARGALIRSTNVHPHEGGFAIASSHDGRLLATAARNEGIRIWDTATGREVQTLQYGAKADVVQMYGLAFSPDDKRLAVAEEDGSVRVYDPAGGNLLLTVNQRPGDGQAVTEARAVSYSPDGRLLAVAYASPAPQDRLQHPVCLFDANTGGPVQSLVDGPGAAAVNNLAFSPDGKYLATADADHLARLWAVAGGGLVRSFAGHSAEVESVAFSPDGVRLATGSLDGTARAWDVTTGRELMKLVGHTGGVRSVAFLPSPAGLGLATASADGTARVWDLASSREWQTLGSNGGPAIGGLAFSPDGGRMATADDAGLAAIWEIGNARPEVLVTIPTQRGPNTWNADAAVAFSADGQHVALASLDDTVTVRAAASGAILATLDLEKPAGIRALAFSPDGSRLATAGQSKIAGIWDAATGRQLLILAGHSAAVNAITYDRQGVRAATAADDGQVILWNAATGERLFALNKAHTGSIWSVAFSPDGTRLATAGQDGTAKVWDLGDRKALLTLAGHMAPVHSVAWSLDGKLLATGSSDTTVKLWDVATGAEEATLSGHADRVTAVAFSPDGSRLAAASDDGTVRFYLLRLDDLIALGRSRVTRSLTATECRQYLHLDACPGN